jgi:hypothetical protein
MADQLRNLEAVTIGVFGTLRALEIRLQNRVLMGFIRNGRRRSVEYGFNPPFEVVSKEPFCLREQGLTNSNVGPLSLTMMESEGLRFDIPSTPGLDSATSAGSGMFSPPDSPSTSGKRMKMQGDQTVYGLQLGLLRKWEDEKKNQLLGTEHAMQEIAVAKVRGFLDAIGEF